MVIPELGPEIPRSGGIGRRWLGIMLLVMYRWRIEGQIPNKSKLIMILAPHTSNWDFLSALATMWATGFGCKFLMAGGYFWWPLGSLLRWLGGVPVNQHMRTDLVSHLTDAINERNKYFLALFPEGRRIKMMEWKTGFARIASNTGVPFQLVTLDYSKRVSIYGPVMESSGNPELDMEKVQRHYQGAVGKNPENFGADSYHREIDQVE